MPSFQRGGHRGGGSAHQHQPHEQRNPSNGKSESLVGLDLSWTRSRASRWAWRWWWWSTVFRWSSAAVRSDGSLCSNGLSRSTADRQWIRSGWPRSRPWTGPQTVLALLRPMEFYLFFFPLALTCFPGWRSTSCFRSSLDGENRSDETDHSLSFVVVEQRDRRSRFEFVLVGLRSLPGGNLRSERLEVRAETQSSHVCAVDPCGHDPARSEQQRLADPSMSKGLSPLRTLSLSLQSSETTFAGRGDETPRTEHRQDEDLPIAVFNWEIKTIATSSARTSPDWEWATGLHLLRRDDRRDEQRHRTDSPSAPWAEVSREASSRASPLPDPLDQRSSISTGTRSFTALWSSWPMITPPTRRSRTNTPLRSSSCARRRSPTWRTTLRIFFSRFSKRRLNTWRNNAEATQRARPTSISSWSARSRATLTTRSRRDPARNRRTPWNRRRPNISWSWSSRVPRRNASPSITRSPSTRDSRHTRNWSPTSNGTAWCTSPFPSTSPTGFTNIWIARTSFWSWNSIARICARWSIPTINPCRSTTPWISFCRCSSSCNSFTRRTTFIRSSSPSTWCSPTNSPTSSISLNSERWEVSTRQRTVRVSPWRREELPFDLSAGRWSSQRESAVDQQWESASQATESPSEEEGQTFASDTTGGDSQ